MSALATEKLNPTERSEWNKCLGVVRKKATAFWELIDAVGVIRKKRLYREKYKTFEDFVVEEVEMSKSHVNRLISALEVKKSLAEAVTATSQNDDSLAHRCAKSDVPIEESISSEAQLRELGKVPKENIAEVAEKAVELAGGESPSVAQIREAADRVVPESPKHPVRPTSSERKRAEKAAAALEAAVVEAPAEPVAPIDEELSLDVKLEVLAQKHDLVDILRAIAAKIGDIDVLEVAIDAAGGNEQAAMKMQRHFPGVVLSLTSKPEPKEVAIPEAPAIADPAAETKYLYETFDVEGRSVVYQTVVKLWDADAEVRKGGAKPKRRALPTLDECVKYCKDRGGIVDGTKFFDWHEQSGWKLANGNPVKDWQATVRNWERLEIERNPTKSKDGKAKAEDRYAYPEQAKPKPGINKEFLEKVSKLPLVKEYD